MKPFLMGMAGVVGPAQIARGVSCAFIIACQVFLNEMSPRSHAHEFSVFAWLLCQRQKLLYASGQIGIVLDEIEDVAEGLNRVPQI